MKKLTRVLVLCVVLVGTANADVPEKFTNLKVFPEDIGKRDLIGAMKSFSAALGVRCSACHEMKVPGDYDSFDWASDKLPSKDVTRGMMKMVQEINGNLLPAATNEHDFRVSCVTCHRGLENPSTLDQVVLGVVAKEGVEAAEARYRELREKYYGTGSYDFAPGTLATVAQTLAQDNGDMAGARAMVVLNLEMNPDDVDSHLMLAQMDLAAGDKEAARASVDKALALDPQNRHAKRLLQQIGQ